jgi:hypothetical protein
MNKKEKRKIYCRIHNENLNAEIKATDELSRASLHNDGYKEGILGILEFIKKAEEEYFKISQVRINSYRVVYSDSVEVIPLINY